VGSIDREECWNANGRLAVRLGIGCVFLFVFYLSMDPSRRPCSHAFFRTEGGADGGRCKSRLKENYGRLNSRRVFGKED